MFCEHSDTAVTALRIDSLALKPVELSRCETQIIFMRTEIVRLCNEPIWIKN